MRKATSEASEEGAEAEGAEAEGAEAEGAEAEGAEAESAEAESASTEEAAPEVAAKHEAGPGVMKASVLRQILRKSSDPAISAPLGAGTVARAQKPITNTGKWGKGTYASPAASLQAHFDKHGAEVGAADAEQYLRKAEGFAQNLRGATRSPVDGGTPGVTRYVKLGKYIDMTEDGTIISFGSRG